MNRDHIHIRVFRVVIAAWLFGWFCKITFFKPYLTEVIHQYPMSHDLFVPIFLNNEISMIFFFLPGVAVFSLFLKVKFLHQFNAIVMFVSAAMMNLHINTYNDATFVTSFWVALWLVWFSFNMNRKDASFYLHATTLAKLIIGMVFLGGFVGKLTDEYWSGVVVYNIFIEQATSSPLEWITGGFSENIQRSIVTLISRAVIFGEFLLALTPFLPTTLACIGGFVLIPLLILCSTWKILSVISGLLGLLIACFLWGRMEKMEF